ncbi:MAG: RNA polymerase sporulation sigma factor SigK [Clostridia bacterium]|nr:RNA polymerase sporulation sigma factor SigK [Clostridia bacterium]
MFKFLLKLFQKEEQDVFYMTNGANALPEKLSADEEREALIAYKKGDESARQTLIEKNLRLVVYLAQKFENTGVNIDDLTSIGTIGLIKAVGSFDIEKNIKFATYASRCIENEILMYLRKSAKLKTDVSLDEPLSVDKDGNELVLADIVGTDNDFVYKQIEYKIENEILSGLVENLNPRERYIMKLRYGLTELETELTQKEVADKLNISQSYISRIEKKVLLKLKRDMIMAE